MNELIKPALEAVTEAAEQSVLEDLAMYASVCEERPERLRKFDSALMDIGRMIED